MTLEQFRESLSAEQPPQGISGPLLGLWWDAKGNWTRAHETAQQEESSAGAWVHAYLHRKEGDLSNAGYWYARARKPQASGTLENEWSQIVQALLSE